MEDIVIGVDLAKCIFSLHGTSDHADLHIGAVGQAQMLFRRDIAQHRGAKPTDHRRPDGAGDMVIAGGDIGGQRPERIERRFAAGGQLLIHIGLDLVHRHMARPVDHHLIILGPSDLGQLTQRLQFGKLRGVVGIRDRTGAQAIAQTEADVIRPHDVADFVKMGVKEAFAAVMQAPFCHDRAATADNPGQRAGGDRWQHASLRDLGGLVHQSLFALMTRGKGKEAGITPVWWCPVEN